MLLVDQVEMFMSTWLKGSMTDLEVEVSGSNPDGGF